MGAGFLVVSGFVIGLRSIGVFWMALTILDDARQTAARGGAGFRVRGDWVGAANEA